jgi:hypothetical protein
MAGLVPAIHAPSTAQKGVDARDEHGHDELWLQLSAAPQPILMNRTAVRITREGSASAGA